MSWWGYALLSAIAASLTAVLVKVGVRDVPSNLATSIRTLVVLVFAWGIVISTGEIRDVAKIPTRSLAFLVLSGVATGVSWLAYFRALELGPVSRVVPIDKLSLPLTILLAAVLLREPLSARLSVGAFLILVGTVVCLR